jgi:hypothetical protein
MARVIVVGIVLLNISSSSGTVGYSGSWCPRTSVECLGVANDHSMIGSANGIVLDWRQNSAAGNAVPVVSRIFLCPDWLFRGLAQICVLFRIYLYLPRRTHQNRLE